MARRWLPDSALEDGVAIDIFLREFQNSCVEETGFDGEFDLRLGEDVPANEDEKDFQDICSGFHRGVWYEISPQGMDFLITLVFGQSFYKKVKNKADKLFVSLSSQKILQNILENFSDFCFPHNENGPDDVSELVPFGNCSIVINENVLFSFFFGRDFLVNLRLSGLPPDLSTAELQSIDDVLSEKNVQLSCHIGSAELSWSEFQKLQINDVLVFQDIESNDFPIVLNRFGVTKHRGSLSVKDEQAQLTIC